MRWVYLLSFIGFIFPAQAEILDLGAYGALFDIKEEDIQHVILKRLRALEATGGLEKHQREIAERVQKTLNRSRRVKGIHKTIKARTFIYDPTLVVKKDIYLPDGRVMHKKGARVNPFDHVDLGQTLLFLDGEDEEQVKWAESQKGRATWILVKGRPFELEKKMSHPIYFDQFGKITTQLGIQQVPARVKQEGKVLRIEECQLNE